MVRGSSGVPLGDREQRSRWLRSSPGKLGRQQEMRRYVSQSSQLWVHPPSTHWIPLTKQECYVKTRSFKMVPEGHWTPSAPSPVWAHGSCAREVTLALDCLPTQMYAFLTFYMYMPYMCNIYMHTWDKKSFMCSLFSFELTSKVETEVNRCFISKYLFLFFKFVFMYFLFFN